MECRAAPFVLSSMCAMCFFLLLLLIKQMVMRFGFFLCAVGVCDEGFFSGEVRGQVRSSTGCV